MSEPYTCRITVVDEEGNVTVPGHGLICGTRVLWKGIAQTGMYVVRNFCQDPDKLKLYAETLVGVAAIRASRQALGKWHVVTSGPHGLKARENPSFFDTVVLQNFRCLNGVSMQVSSIGVHELLLSTEGNDRLKSLFNEFMKGGLSGTEVIRLPDRSLKGNEIPVVGCGEFLEVAPRSPAQNEVEGMWHSTITRIFPHGLPPQLKVFPEHVPAAISIKCCGMAACMGKYVRDDLATNKLSHGCVTLSFEPCVGLWVITASLRSSSLEPFAERRCSEEPLVEWEGPQLLYICCDADPTGRWTCVLGAEPAPCQITVIQKHESHELSELPSITLQFNLYTYCFHPEHLGTIFGFLLDFRTSDWRTFVDTSRKASRGPQGLSAADIAHRIFKVGRDACQMACVCRSWHAGTTVGRKFWPSGLRRALQIHHAGGQALDISAILMLARVGRQGLADMLSVTRDPAFANRCWAVSLAQIKVSHELPAREGDQLQPTGDFVLTNCGPALLAFARALFPAEEVSWQHRKDVHVGMMKRSGDRWTSEHLDLLECAWLRPESLRGRALFLCEGVSGTLLSHAGTPLIQTHMRTAIGELRSGLQLAFPGLGPTDVSVAGFKTGYSSLGHKGGRHPCPCHSRIQNSCSWCKEHSQNTHGWNSLAASSTLTIVVHFPSCGRQELQLCVTAPVIPFVAISSDRKLGKLPPTVARRQLQKHLHIGD